MAQRTHSPKADHSAIPVAERVERIARSELAILFGSRARGTHHERSDLDIMLVTDVEPNPDYRARVATEAAAYADKLYPRPVAIQLVWRGVDEFRRNRRYVNSVETNARKEGVIRRVDPEMRDFRLPIAPDIYSQYAVSMAYMLPKPNIELTSIDEYASKTTDVIETILRRALQVRG